VDSAERRLVGLALCADAARRRGGASRPHARSDRRCPTRPAGNSTVVARSPWPVRRKSSAPTCGGEQGRLLGFLQATPSQRPRRRYTLLPAPSVSMTYRCRASRRRRTTRWPTSRRCSPLNTNPLMLIVNSGGACERAIPPELDLAGSAQPRTLNFGSSGEAGLTHSLHPSCELLPRR